MHSNNDMINFIHRVCVGIQCATCLVKCSMVAELLMTMISDYSIHMQR